MICPRENLGHSPSEPADRTDVPEEGGGGILLVDRDPGTYQRDPDIACPHFLF